MSVLEWILGAFGLMTVSKHVDELVRLEAEYVGKLRNQKLDAERAHYDDMLSVRQAVAEMNEAEVRRHKAEMRRHEERILDLLRKSGVA